jgi:hypothetical protein
MSRQTPSNPELDWAAKAFERLLHQATFSTPTLKKSVLEFLMEAPDTIKARVTEFEATEKIGDDNA